MQKENTRIVLGFYRNADLTQQNPSYLFTQLLFVVIAEDIFNTFVQNNIVFTGRSFIVHANFVKSIFPLTHTVREDL